MSHIQTPSVIGRGADNEPLSLIGKPRLADFYVGATPRRPALGEVSNFRRQQSHIDATPKLRSYPHQNQNQKKQSSSDSDEFEAAKSIRRMSCGDFDFGRVKSPDPEVPCLETIGDQEFSDDESENDDDYPPIEHMSMPPKGYDEDCMLSIHPDEKKMFAKMKRGSDLVTMFVSAEFSFIPVYKAPEVRLDYEPVPDATKMALDLSDVEM